MNIPRKTFLKFAALPFAALLTKAKGFGAGGQRWGMAIDTQKCLKEQGCTRCLDACHRTHNVPAIADPRREVKWVWKERFSKLFPAERLPSAVENSPMPVMCNHCDNPPCTRVCPTGATFKRADGLVVMDEHRCIGCRYCMAACPYGSRSFNWSDPVPHVAKVNPEYPCRTKGVVEKCTFCAERLNVGKLPLCVEACPERVMVFGDLNDPRSEIRSLLGSRYSLRRRAELGTGPSVFYIL
jgi:molybdopterin-containing oxidoreductase family iron-sulfur binding subunit